MEKSHINQAPAESYIVASNGAILREGTEEQIKKYLLDFPAAERKFVRLLHCRQLKINVTHKVDFEKPK